MPEPLKLTFRPGVNRESTEYGNTGGWFSCNLVRFREGRPESMLGWQRFTVSVMQGTPRSLLPWAALDNSRFYACGTHLKYYLIRGGEPLDITPIRRTATLGNNPFSSDGVGSTIFTVTDTAHGAVLNDFVTYSGVTGPIAGVPASEFNTEHQIIEIIGPSSYRISVTTPATQAASATAFNVGETGPFDLAFDPNTNTLYMNGIINDVLYTVDTTTGVATQVGAAVAFGVGETVPTGLAFDPNTNTLYMTGVLTDDLHTVDVTTGVATQVGAATTFGVGEASPMALAFDANTNTLYMVGDVNNVLYTVNTTTGVATQVGNAPNFGAGINTPGGLAFDPNTNTLYLGGFNNATLNTLNTTTGVATQIGSTPLFGVGEGAVRGLAFDSNTNTLYMAGSTNAVLYTVNTTTGVATAVSSSTGGGAAVSAAYQINVGLDSTVLGTGWGVEGWGLGGWGEAATTAVVSDRLRLWHEDNVSEDVVFNVRDGQIFYKDLSTGVAARAVELQTLAGASDTPVVARQVLVSDNDRHTIAFGTNEIGSIIQDKQLIRWSDRESVANWTPDTVTSAGSLRINRGSEIIRALETQREILVFTDTSLHSMRFIGAPDVFGQVQVGENVSLIAPKAVVSDGSVVYWMGRGHFYLYDGRVQELPCTLESFIFDFLTELQTEKISTGVNRRESEIWWFLPYADAPENSLYVIYNYQQKIWYYGDLPRTVWIDSQFEPVPLAGSPDGFIYSHEVGNDDGSVIPNVPLPTFIESSDFEIGDGYHFMLSRRLYPDITFIGSTTDTPTVTITLQPRNYPGANFGPAEGGTVARSAVVPVEQFTTVVPARVRGREIKYRIEGTQLGLRWRQGLPRLEARPDGRA